MCVCFITHTCICIHTFLINTYIELYEKVEVEYARFQVQEMMFLWNIESDIFVTGAKICVGNSVHIGFVM